MISIKATPEDNAKSKIEDAMFARLTMYEGKPPTYFILTYNEKTQEIHIFGANKTEELNLTISYFPDEPLLAVVNNINPDNSDDGRENDSIIDLVADPIVPVHLTYNLDSKEFAIGQLEQKQIEKRDAILGPVPKAFERVSQEPKTPETPAQKPATKPDRSFLKLVVDNE